MLFCIVTFSLWLHYNKLRTYLLTYLYSALYGKHFVLKVPQVWITQFYLHTTPYLLSTFVSIHQRASPLIVSADI